MATLRDVGVCLLGPLQVDGGRSLEPRDRVTLGVLAVRLGLVVSPDQLAEALWGDHPPRSWAKQVQICIGRLRKVLGADVIETTSGGYRLTIDGEDVDICRFEGLVERARALAATGEADRAAATYSRALSLWRGPPLDDLDGWTPGRSEAARLEELRRTAEEDQLESRLAAGEHRDVAVAAETLVGTEPLRERRWAILAMAQYRCSRQADALRSLARARRTLAEELGIDRGSELIALEAAILRQDPALDAIPEPSAVSEACPYKGLAPYGEHDAEAFFGRDAEVSACLERLRSTSLLLVSGPSGCGKSSLVRAGIVPALRRRGHEAVVCSPGPDPLDALNDATSTVEEAAVLVVDQFEELFALGAPDEVVRAFCQRLVDRARAGSAVIIALRSDQLGGLGVETTFSRLAEQGLHLVSPLAGDALRDAIERPAAMAGLRLEHGLVELLVRDCEGEPGGLPLLSHALTETWRRRDGQTLTVEGYQASGGIRGAVARSADRLYEGLDEGQRASVRSVLLRLVTPSIGGDPVRCRVPSRHLLGDPGRERVVALLVRSRLVTSEQNTFEIAHEALARAWPRLRSWLEEDAAGQRILRHLVTAADGWDSLGRPDTELYRGARLEAALEWWRETDQALTDVEQAFINASSEHAAAENQALAERADRDAAQNRRLRGLLVGLAVLLVGSLVVGAVALRESDRARLEGRVASVRELSTAAIADLGVDPERSILLALEAVELARSTDPLVQRDAVEALHRAITTSRIERRVPGVGGVVEWSPAGDAFVAAGPDGSGIVEIRGTGTGTALRSFEGHDGNVTGVSFGHRGTLLGTTGPDGVARVWDSATGEELHTMRGPDGSGAWSPAFSPDGRLFAAVWPDDDGGLVRILRLSTGDVAQELRSMAGASSISFDPSGTKLAVASELDPIGVVVDLESGEPTLALEGHLHGLTDVAWSPDGESIATAGFDGSARVFDAGSGRPNAVLSSHASHVVAVDWSPASERLATASADGTAKVWSLIGGAGREMMSLSSHDTRSGVGGVSFSPDGTHLVSGDVGRAGAIIWDVGISSGAEIGNVRGVAFFYSVAAFTADGRHLLTTGEGGTVSIWDARTLSQVRTLGVPPSEPSSGVRPTVPVGSPDDMFRIVPADDGRLVATIREGASGWGIHEGTVQVWDARTGRAVFTTHVGSWAADAGWSPAGEHLAIAGGDAQSGSITIVDRTGAHVRDIVVPGRRVDSARFSPDGERLVTTVEALGEYDAAVGQLQVWDWRRGETLLTVNTESWFAVASPAGDVVATAPHEEAVSQDVTVWDIDTGETVATLRGHTGTVLDLSFSPDGSKLATAGGDGTTRLWNAATGEELQVLSGHVGLVSSVAFNVDGSRLATAGVDGTVRVWALDREELLDIARSRLTRGFTAEECRSFLHRPTCGTGMQPTEHSR